MSFRTVAPRLLLALVATVASLAVFEVALRRAPGFGWYRPPGARSTERYPPYPFLSRYRPGRYEARAVQGDLSHLEGTRDPTQGRPAVFVNDELGFPNPPGTAARGSDLILLADSFGAGGTITDELTWSRLLESRHGRRVYSMSVPGNPWQEMMNLKLTLDRIRIEPGAVLVWALFTGNDFYERFPPNLDPPPPASGLDQLRTRWSVLRRTSALGQLGERAFRTRRQPAPVRDVVVRRTLPDGRSILFYQPYAKQLGRGAGFIKVHPHFEQWNRVLRETIRVAASRGLPLGVVLIPTKEQIYDWALEGRPPGPPRHPPQGIATVTVELLAEAGVPVLDLEPLLHQKGRELWEKDGTLLWWRDDTHWGPAGHREAADAVARELLPKLTH